ncbi:MAG: hypothetical protein JO186_04925 [Actinobacteria bacterium]|nr:hypothetical protein [Actinomycetota bacterium]
MSMSANAKIAVAVVVLALAAVGAVLAATHVWSSATTRVAPIAPVTGAPAAGAPAPGLGGGGGFAPRGGFGFRGGLGGGLQAAATYLGESTASLRTDLVSGKSLAAVAKSKGKSVDGLVSAMVAAEKTRISQAAANGRFPQALVTQFESSLQQRVTALVNGTFGPGFGFGNRRGFGPGGDDGGAVTPGGSSGTF